MSEMIERVAHAIGAVHFFSRFNNWTSDRVPGCPIEICRNGADGEDDIVVVHRFGGAITEREALDQVVSEYRARAAIEAMREPTGAMMKAGADFHDIAMEAPDDPAETPDEFAIIFRAMIDEALK